MPFYNSALCGLDYYPSGHTEANGYLGIVYLNRNRPSHKHGAHLGYLPSRPDTESTQAAGDAVAAQNFNNDATLPVLHMNQGQLFPFWRHFMPVSELVAEPAPKPMHRLKSLSLAGSLIDYSLS
jgi:hypothetical protein